MPPPIDVSRFEQLKASGDLPSPKGVALAIMRMTLQEEVSIHDLANFIRTDPAFVGRLVKSANGIVGYGHRPVVSVHDALTILGMPAVRNMALGFSLLTHYHNGGCEGFDYKRFWSSSLLRAVGMQAITMRTRVTAPDEAYCLGLLSRVGELALATLYPHDYGKVAVGAQGDPRRLTRLETDTFAMNNAELGAAMLADWGLPRQFTDVAFHVASGLECNSVEGSREAILIHTLALSHQLGNACLAPKSELEACLEQVRQTGSLLSFDANSLGTLSEGVAAEWREWGSLLGLEVPSEVSYEALQVHSLVNAPTLVAKPVEQTTVSGEIAVADEIKAVIPGRHYLEAGADGANRQLRVLIVERDAVVRSNLARILEAGGYQVEEVEDGYTAMEKALDFIPDIMLLGWVLPDVSGIDTLRTLRRTRIGRAIYAVVMGEEITEEKIIIAFDAGADDLLPKPVNARLLLAKMRAGRRLTVLHQEIEQDKEEIRRAAADLAVSNRRLQEAAMIDPLTDCPNRRCFSERFAQEWAIASRSARPLSCMVLDIDNFKNINDTFGHDAGDSALRQVAMAARSVLRTHDLIARVGGDEFVILCPDTAIELASRCAERVRLAVEHIQVSASLPHLRISVSIGLSSRNQNTPDPDSLMKYADQGLYQAKQDGRNRVVTIMPGEDG
jgi:two-component system, cell cycle response regulator